jgi:hypothetical protein
VAQKAVLVAHIPSVVVGNKAQGRFEVDSILLAVEVDKVAGFEAD